MSAHKHDEEIIKRNFGNTSKGKAIQKKVDDQKDEQVRDALLKADIKGLSRDQAKKKLYSIVDSILG